MVKLILIAAAVIPAVYLMVRVYRADRLEKEPAGMLIGLLILGVISTSLAGITEQLGEMFLGEFFPEEGIVYGCRNRGCFISWAAGRYMPERVRRKAETFCATFENRAEF